VLLGVDSHSLAPDGGAGGAGTAGGSGGGAGTGGTGEIYGPANCGADGSVVDGSEGDAGAGDAGTGANCGFTMPNPESSDPLLFPNQAKYHPNSDGTVDDLVTHLTWDRGTFQVFSQYEADTPCKEKGGGWRLPNRVELASLVDFTVPSPGPTLNQVFKNDPTFGNPGDTKVFWTSSHAVCNTAIAWHVDFSTGATKQEAATLPYKVRCVKGAPSNCSSPRFEVQQDEVHDLGTGLIWQQAVASDLTWSAALQHCPAGWRLPSLTEIQTIVDDTRQNPAIFPMFNNTSSGLNGTPNPVFWTSSPFAGDSSQAWYDTFYHGHSSPQTVDLQSFVRCVR